MRHHSTALVGQVVLAILEPQAGRAQRSPASVLGGAHFEADRDVARRMRANAHALADAPDNALSNEIAAAVTALDTRLRTHLTRPA